MINETIRQVLNESLESLNRAVENGEDKAAETCREAENNVLQAVHQCQTNTSSNTDYSQQAPLLTLCGFIIVLQCFILFWVIKLNCTAENGCCSGRPRCRCSYRHRRGQRNPQVKPQQNT